jgi:signal transduction histidine kinase
LKLDLAPELWPVEADPAQLDAALMNLAMNARQAMPDGGELTIRTANVEQHGLDGLHGELDAEDVEPGDYVMIAVTDTGIGMSPEVREKAFEPFFTTRPTGIGSGLGLSQIYGFVKQSRGRVFLHTEPGRGTTVTLLLRRPASSASPVPLARVAASS